LFKIPYLRKLLNITASSSIVKYSYKTHY